LVARNLEKYILFLLGLCFCFYLRHIALLVASWSLECEIWLLYRISN